MSKKFFATLIVAVVATFAGYNIYQSQRTVTMSDLALANVEALAWREIGDSDCRMNTVTWVCLWGEGTGCYCGMYENK